MYLHLVILHVVASVVTAKPNGRWVPTFHSTYGRGFNQPFDSSVAGTLGPRGIPQDNNTLGISELGISTDLQTYYSLITVGAVQLRVAIDTASSDLLVVSSGCKTSTCTTVPQYPLAYKSDSFVAINDNTTLFNVGYSDGTTASGFIAQEKVVIANFTLTGQTFGLVQDSNITREDTVSGVLGLGFSRLSSLGSLQVNGTPFVVDLAQQGKLAYPLFGLSARNSSGSLSIGAIDSSVVTNTSQIAWSEVVQFAPFGAERNASTYLQWAIPLDGFQIDNDTVLVPSPTYVNIRKASIALMDIGTSGIYGPYQDVSRIFSSIEGSRLVDAGKGQWVVPCSTTAPMTFIFGQKKYSLQASDYLIGPASGNTNLCFSWPMATQPSSDGIDWQFGTPFFRTVYSVFSYGINTKERPLIGLYSLQNTPTPDTTAITTAAATTTPTPITSFITTIGTTLPNFLVPTPTYMTPVYAFNTSVSLPSRIASTGLATSTYSALIKSGKASVLPTVSPAPTQATLVFTDANGVAVTSLSIASTSSVALGVPPGWSVNNGAVVPGWNHALKIGVLVVGLINVFFVIV